MWLLIVEAFIALGMLVFIVWWTMSSRRRVEDQSAAGRPAEPPALAVDAEATKAVTHRDGDDASGPKPG